MYILTIQNLPPFLIKVDFLVQVVFKNPNPQSCQDYNIHQLFYIHAEMMFNIHDENKIMTR